MAAERDFRAGVCDPHHRQIDNDATKEIAVKVINQYGDEVLKVYECRVEGRNADGLVALSATDG